jgi:hypothetical protein
VVEEQAPAAGAEALAAWRSVEEVARTAEAAMTRAAAAPPEPSRKRKRGFSSLR